MVVREYVQCLACNTKLILRVGIGPEISCEHTFDCPTCGTPSTIEGKTGTPPAAWIEVRENLQIIEEHEDAEIVVNLHPSFAFHLAYYHSPYAFASMQAGKLIFPHARVPAGSRSADISTQFEVPNTIQVWSAVRSVCNLSLKDDPAGVLTQQIKKYETLRREYKPSFTCETSFQCIASFFDDLFYPAIGNLRRPLRAFARQQKNTHPGKFQDLLAYYQANIETESLNRNLSTFTDYFRHFHQFRQVLAHARVSDENVDDLVVGSKKFDEIKLYYGQVYEALTSAYVILATLFNLSEGRAFDTFSAMSLKKYITDVEKSKRANPFSSVPELSAFTRFDDSSLRNGSHHASIWREGELVKFRSGGAGAERDISFSRYLHICNGATISLAALFLVELEFFSAIRIS